MTKVSRAIEVRAAPEHVWAIMGDPASIAAWHPAIAASPLTDGIRHCALEGGGEVDELIVEHSEEGRYYVYTIPSSPFEMSGYLSRIEVEGTDSGARISWDGEFEADDLSAAQGLAEAFIGVYESGLESIRDLAESS
jgi:hypothetical protein